MRGRERERLEGNSCLTPPVLCTYAIKEEREGETQTGREYAKGKERWREREYGVT